VLRRVYVFCLITYSGVVAWVTLRSLPNLGSAPDLVPFLDTWRQMRDYGDRATLWEVGGNFMLFVPFGFFLAAVLRRDVRTVGALASLTSVVIELAQWAVVNGRNPSVDDVIYNTAGAVAGAIVFVLVRGAVEFRRERSSARAADGGGVAD
jgi:glycopeptide antibiotics resistance protein